MTNIFESVIKPERSDFCPRMNKPSDKRKRFFRAIRFIVIVLFFFQQHQPKENSSQQDQYFHRCSLYTNLHHESRGIFFTFALGFESDYDTFRIEKAQVALIAVDDRQTKVSFR
jgi:hypothetical protein